MSKPTKRSNKVHPSSSHLHHSQHHHHLALLLPAAILSLTAVLSPDETEVLAYLISCHSNSSGNQKSATFADCDDDGGVYTPVFGCNCFRCYTNFWSRWDASPNRDLIHKIIEAYEEGLSRKKSNKARKKRKNDNINKESDEKASSTQPVEGGSGSGAPVTRVGVGEVGSPEQGSSVRKVIGFIGGKIWGAWNRQ